MSGSQTTSYEDMVQTAEGPTFVRMLGQGPLVIVVHGGPGFDHTYLYPVLKSLAERRTLLFYDQPGCGRTPEPDEGLSPDQCFRHLRCLANQFAQNKPIGVIAHSWGALVLVGALAGDGRPDPQLPAIGEGMLINPSPVSSEKYEVARANLIRQIPRTASLRATLRALLTGNGRAVMRLLLPYYCFDAANIPAAGIPLKLSTYRKIDAQLKGFNFSKDLSLLANVAIVRGSHEFASESEIDDLIAHASAVSTLEEAGHFPFWEAPEAFGSFLMGGFR